jgi:hypothetical protein
MKTTDGDPIRLDEPRPYRRPLFPRKTEIALPPPRAINVSMLRALLRRRSGEDFEPISDQALSNWLHFCFSIQSVNAEDSNRQRGYVGSFGALHATHILLGKPNHLWSVYLPETHSLGSLSVNLSAAKSLRELAVSHYISATGTLVVLLANIDLVSAYYEQFRELLQKDAGVQLGHASLVASGLDLSFRILGSNGSPWAQHLVPDVPFSTSAVGLAWIGGQSNGG